ncbi:hypothetical protein ACGF12_32180 [Kitasatospora sp. NPDC048296]|uniref:hypothetical protein n=1 Tax=Kitasatospora sp. NPDC048296 TaxID=3364048 RepID=UPI003721D712
MADGAWQRPGDDDLSGLSSEERALRELMHHAVAGIQPGSGALPRIRQAVPRRQAARRGAWTGAAALALAVAVALPVLHDGDHLGLSGGPGSAEAQSPTPTAPGGRTGGGSAGTGAAVHTGPSGTGDTTSSSGTASASPSPGVDTTRPGLTPTPTGAPGTGDGGIVPLCTRTDLGQGTAQVGAADGQGRIYGSFTVYNVSGRSCRLGGPGAVAVTEVSGADRSRVRTADHTPGDPAGSLPAMDTEPPVLAPQAGYRVPFAWIPDQGCGSGGSGGTVTSAPTGANQVALTTQAPGAASDAPASGNSAAPSSNPQASATPTSGPTPAPSPTATPTGSPTTGPATATIAHTPAPGSPAAATASLPVACGGTLYRGGVQSTGGAAAQPSGTPAAG